MKRIIWIVLIAVTALSIAPAASAGQFKKAGYYKLGDQQEAFQVISARFTHSGNLDLAVAGLSNGVSVLLGNGNGTFQKALTVAASNPADLVAADLDGDGNMDLVVVESGGTGNGALDVFLGDGTGHFRKKASYPLGLESARVATADFNGDGHPDIAVTNQGDLNHEHGNVMVFLGKGDGTLEKPAVYKLPNSPFGIEAGELNSHAYSDLAVTEFTGNSVAVLLNDGTGKFHLDATYGVGAGEAMGVAIGDLNHDGKPDLVVANVDAGIDVLLNQGGGKFGDATLYPNCKYSCDPGPFAVVIADFNLDGNLDVAGVNIGQKMVLYYGKGNGKFDNPVPIYIWLGGGYSLTAGDFNNDGAPDLAVVPDGTDYISVLLNTQ